MSLRESEIDYIENPSPGEIIANILPGNYEETKDSKEYIKNKIKIVFNFMKIDRDNIQKQKNEIGQKMIDLGIVKGDAVKPQMFFQILIRHKGVMEVCCIGLQLRLM